MRDSDKKIEIKKDGFVCQIVFDVSVDEQLNYVKSGEEPPYRYRIIIRKDKKRIAEYVREFKGEPSSTHLNRFFKKVLANKEYREQYLSEGTWDGIINWEELVNPNTKRQIKSINSTPIGKLKFKDFMNLKTDGIDGFSKMKKEKIEQLLTKEDSERIDRELEKERIRLSAKRWVARGLEVEKAIRKIKTDEEVRMNAERTKTSAYSYEDEEDEDIWDYL